jgi:hypothetical protein
MKSVARLNDPQRKIASTWGAGRVHTFEALAREVLKHDGTPWPGHNGDPLVRKPGKMISVLQDPDQWLNEQTGLPDAILVSGGGDDLVGDQLAIYLDYGGGGLNLNRFQGTLDAVQASYMDLFAFRDIFAKGVPIISHCYDYAIPNDVHPVCTDSAWLWLSLSFSGYDYDVGLHIVSQMINLPGSRSQRVGSELAIRSSHRFRPRISAMAGLFVARPRPPQIARAVPAVRPGR